MNMVYIARKVGRDRDKMIKDSSGISFTDNFCLKTSDTNHTWNELNTLRDKSRELSLYALTGKTKNPTGRFAEFQARIKELLKWKNKRNL